MKALLVIGLLALLMMAPGVAAADNPICPGEGLKECAVKTLEDVLFGGCDPHHQYVKECEPEEPS